MAARTIGRLAPQSAALFVCDIQERFVPLITGMPNVIDTAKRMVRGAQALGVPVLATEQYPKALGPTVPELKELLGPTPTIVSKTLFSMVTPEVEEWLKSRPDVKQVLLLGIETHVCVLQTSLDLLAKGYEVHLIVDGVSSQRPHDRAAGLHRISQSGGFLTSSEMVLFQMAKDAKNPAFKAISNLAKEARLEPIPFTAML